MKASVICPAFGFPTQLQLTETPSWNAAKFAPALRKLSTASEGFASAARFAAQLVGDKHWILQSSFYQDAVAVARCYGYGMPGPGTIRQAPRPTMRPQRDDEH